MVNVFILSLQPVSAPTTCSFPVSHVSSPLSCLTCLLFHLNKAIFVPHKKDFIKRQTHKKIYINPYTFNIRVKKLYTYFFSNINFCHYKIKPFISLHLQCPCTYNYHGIYIGIREFKKLLALALGGLERESGHSLRTIIQVHEETGVR